ncbi:MAG: hypothetical protein A4S12_11630 [Proteobacteria bacterium SG_bin5]|nr:MAG: hypothetical protein A4S12_11630 [Proteobacteria bacterium SG_bin5]
MSEMASVATRLFRTCPRCSPINKHELMDRFRKAVEVIWVNRRRQARKLQCHLQNRIIVLVPRRSLQFINEFRRYPETDTMIQRGGEQRARRLMTVTIFHEIKQDIQIKGVECRFGPEGR